MRTYKHLFLNAQGHQLSALLDLPIDGKPAAYALFSHCFTGNKHLKAVKHISQALTQADIAVFRFDFTGLGQSEGDFAETNFSSNVSDLIAAADYMAGLGMAPQLLIGHSLGGAAAIMASPSISSIKATVTLGTPSDPAHVQHNFERHVPEIEADGEANVLLGGRKFRIKKQFLLDLATHDLGEILHKHDRALLVMHSPQDETVKIAHAAKLYQQAKHPKSFITLDGADHLLTREADALYAGQVIASWASRYLALKEDGLVESEKHLAVHTDRSLFTDIKAGNFRLLADERTSFGGTGFAPTPYDLMLSALGASMGIFIQQQAIAAQWPLAWVRVHIDQSHAHGSDCQAVAHINRLHIQLEAKGALSESQQLQVIDWGKQAPVAQMLGAHVQLSFLPMKME